VGTVLKHFVFGIAVILAINVALYFLLGYANVGPTASFFTLALASLASLFVLGCLLHLRLLDGQELSQNTHTYRADSGKVALLQQNENGKVTPISIDQQHYASLKKGAVLPKVKLPMPNPPTGKQNLPTPRSLEAAKQVARVSWSMDSSHEDNPDKKEINENISIPDLMQEIHIHGRKIKEIISRFRLELRDLEADLLDTRDSLEANTEIPALEDAKKIIAALEARLGRLGNPLISHDPADLIKARNMLQQPLVMPRDAVHDLVRVKELPALPPADWQPTLERLFSEARAAADLNALPRVQNL
jgi:hypothetical protein